MDLAVVSVATTTGTGWIKWSMASSVEYLFNGSWAKRSITAPAA